MLQEEPPESSPLDSKVDSALGDGGARDPVAAAREASAAGPLAQRVSELETLLAVERAEASRRLREMDGLMRETRTALHDLQGDFRRAVSARDELRGRLRDRDAEIQRLTTRVEELRVRAERATSEREGSTAEVVAAAIARAQRSEAELARAREAARALEARIAGLEAEGGGERAAELERDLASARHEIERLRSTRPAAAAPRRPSSGSSTYIPVDVDVPSDTPRRSGAGETDGELADDARAAPPAAGTGAAAQPRPAASRSRVRRRPPPSLPVLPGFSVEREVDRDSAGVLLLARDDATDRGVAVRVLPRGTVRPSPAVVARLCAVRHHNLAAVLRCGLAADGPYVVSERAAGERVDAWVRRVGGVPERIALAVLVQVARALREAASHGVSHGDLSATSLWTDADGVVRVTGTGLWELLPQREPVAPAPYVAPERRRGDPPDARSDLFSLGACLRFLLGGHSALEEPERLLDVRPRLSPRVLGLAGSLAAADRESRPDGWDAAVAQLSEALRASSSDAAGEPAEDDAAGGGVLSSPWAQRGAAALALIALLAAAWMHFAPGDGSALREAYTEAVVRAERLEANGNVEGARRVYLRFVAGTGDEDIELDAARRLDRLRR